MLSRILGGAALAAALVYTLPAGADSWDPGDDTAAGTRNELVHGSDQIHDLAPIGITNKANSDFYRVSQKKYSSFEVVVDTTSSAIGPTLLVELVTVDSAGNVTQVKASSGVSGLGYTQSLRFWNDTSSVVDDQYIRVKSGGTGSCTTGCTTDDVYRIRFFNTTQRLARYNETSGQDTYIFATNPTDYTIAVKIFWLAATGGAVNCTSSFSLLKRQLANVDDDHLVIHGTVSDTCASGNLENTAGHAILISDARYGDLKAAGASIDPGTDWQFQGDMRSRPY